MADNRKDSRGRVLRKGEYERKDGRYYYVYTDVTGKRAYVYAKDLKELRKLKQEAERDLADGICNASGKMTLNQLFNMHMELKHDIRQSTAENYKRMWRSSVEASAIGRKKICELKKVHIMGFYHDCAKSGKKRNTVKLLHNLIYSALELAADSDFIRKNPAKGAMQFFKRDAEVKVPLSETDIKNLMEFCVHSRVYCEYVPFLTIAIGTCLRCGELTGLTWNDIDMKRRIISINHQLVYKNYGEGCRFYISEPKTEAGKRVIPMPEAVYQAFVRIKEQNMLSGRRSTAQIDGYQNFVFVTKSGWPFADNAVNSFLRNIQNAYNKSHRDRMLPHLSAHILRHTGCTRFASSGMDVKTLQNIMGHSDAGITMNVYNHSSFDRIEKEIRRLDECHELMKK